MSLNKHKKAAEVVLAKKRMDLIDEIKNSLNDQSIIDEIDILV